MKKCVVPFVVAMIIFTSCRVERPYYETPIGKKKQDYTIVRLKFLKGVLFKVALYGYV
ncbi:MAG: hypothetical protein ING84_06450 [Cytophagales bacterium]|nr:hypothetical protein [Cytophagales bacterium]MCA6373575.1 hypothetical protein [Cytophagales bacterium]MCA6377999.1 hypothetical protein [Cytophagales bacterium]MCA6382650.1 hypothetical protein [Cytophagales bacterium]